jgi:hypothetical protein
VLAAALEKIVEDEMAGHEVNVTVATAGVQVLVVSSLLSNSRKSLLLSAGEAAEISRIESKANKSPCG